MSISLTPPIGFSNVKNELGLSTLNTFSLKEAERGNYNLLGLNHCSTYRPDEVANYSLSEWYGYNHTQACATPPVYPRNITGVSDFLQTNDGRVIAVGTFTGYTANNIYTSKNNIFKFDSEFLGHAGDFGAGVYPQFINYTSGSLSGYPNAIAKLNDGSLIIVGNFSGYQYSSHTWANLLLDFPMPYGMIKLTPQGTVNLNDDFYTNAWFGLYNINSNNQAIKGMGYCCYVNPIDNTIFIGGAFSRYSNRYVQNIIKIYSDGSIIQSFSDNCKLNDDVLSIDKSNQGLYLAGKFASTQLGTTNIYHALIRVNLDGTTDTGFNPNGGSFVDTNGLNNPYEGAWVNCVRVRSDSIVIAGGRFLQYLRGGTLVGSPHYIVALNIDGTIASTFGGGLNNNVNCIEIQSDNKIIVGGEFINISAYSSTGYIKGIIRYNSDYTIDSAFMQNIGSGPQNANSSGVATVTRMEILSSGEILVTGEFNSWNGNTNMQGIALLNNDGTLAWS